MTITYGTSYVGKIDRLAGSFYVVTKVFQVVNVPLIPLSGHIVWEGTETESFIAGLQDFEGEDIPLSFKSFGYAWLRTLWFGGSLLGIIGVLPLSLGFEALPRVVWLALHLLSIIALVVWFRTRQGLRLKNRDRGLELASVLDIPKDEFKRLWRRSFELPSVPR